MAIAYGMVLPLRTLASSNGCKTRQSDWCAHFKTWIRHIVINIFIRLHWLPIKFRINFKIAMLCFKCIHGQARSYLKSMIAIKKTSTYNRRSSTSIQLEDHSRDDRKKRLAIVEPFPMHPPRFGTVSRNHYNHSKILALSHCLKRTISEKGLIYNFFLVFHIVYIFAFYCKFRILNR